MAHALNFSRDFWISVEISGFQLGFLDFSWDFWISVRISGFQLGFLDFRWISNGFLDFTWISGFRPGFLDFGLDFCDGVRDFSRVGPLDLCTMAWCTNTVLCRMSRFPKLLYLIREGTPFRWFHLTPKSGSENETRDTRD